MTMRQPVVEIIDPMVVEVLRKKTPAEKLAQAFGMWDFAVSMLQANLHHEHPEWTTDEIQREMRRRIRGSPDP